MIKFDMPCLNCGDDLNRLFARAAENASRLPVQERFFNRPGFVFTPKGKRWFLNLLVKSGCVAGRKENIKRPRIVSCACPECGGNGRLFLRYGK